MSNLLKIHCEFAIEPKIELRSISQIGSRAPHGTRKGCADDEWKTIMQNPNLYPIATEQRV